MPREGDGLDVCVAELENIVEHKGIGITNHDEVDDCDNTTDFDDQEVEQYRGDIDGGQDLEGYAAQHGQVNGAEHEDHDEERCQQNDGCAEEWTEEDDYGESGRWNNDEDHHSESDDGTWAVHECGKCGLHARAVGGGRVSTFLERVC